MPAPAEVPAPGAVQPAPGRRAALRALSAVALAATGLAAAGLVAPGAARAADLDRVRAAGVLKVAVYKEFAPFSDGTPDAMRGLDVELARALAAALGVRLALLPFDAGENMSDDLRNMVWKGHYLGYGPADVLLHVPVDRRFMQAHGQVLIFGPYYRETLVLVHELERLARVDGPDDLAGVPLAAERGSAGAMALLGAAGGRLREQVRITATPAEAMGRLLAGEVAAAMLTRAQAESALAAAGAEAARRYRIGSLALPAMPAGGWAVGMAVRADARALAAALEEALGRLRAEGELARLYERSGVTLVAP